MNSLKDDFNNLIDLFQKIKRQVRRKDNRLYEQWKAGGFIIDSDIMSMYPNLEEVVENLQESEDHLGEDQIDTY